MLETEADTPTGRHSQSCSWLLIWGYWMSSLTPWVIAALLLTSAELDKGGCPLSRDGDFLQPNQPMCIAGVIAHLW